MGIKKTVMACAVAGIFAISADTGFSQFMKLPGQLPPVQIKGQFRFDIQIKTAETHLQLGPWYSYFPYEAYFNAPAPIGMQYPNWPNPFPPVAPQPSPPPTKFEKVAPIPPPNPVPPAVQPVGYNYHRYGVPSYWYGR